MAALLKQKPMFWLFIRLKALKDYLIFLLVGDIWTNLANEMANGDFRSELCWQIGFTFNNLLRCNSSTRLWRALMWVNPDRKLPRTTFSEVLTGKVDARQNLAANLLPAENLNRFSPTAVAKSAILRATFEH